MYPCASYYTISCDFGQAIFKGISEIPLFRRSAQIAVTILYIFPNRLCTLIDCRGFRCLNLPHLNLIRRRYTLYHKIPILSRQIPHIFKRKKNRQQTQYLRTSKQADARYMHLPVKPAVKPGYSLHFPQLLQMAAYLYCKRDSGIRPRCTPP